MIILRARSVGRLVTPALVTTALVAGALCGLTPTAPAVAASRHAPAASISSTAGVPMGTTTVLEGAAWSWFEDERVAFAAGGTQLLASAVTGSASQSPAPGTVVLAQLDLGSGERRLVDLGRAEADDHNSAAIFESESGELTTAWSRHNKDRFVRLERRRTDGSWLRLPPEDIQRVTTYSNLRAATDEQGQPLLYDFVRGVRFDPEVIASADAGRTWSRLGRILRDPEDGANRRPYVQYAPSSNGRVHFVATDNHPRDGLTAVYHGYIESGSVYASGGAVLGPLGSAIPVTNLTRVWAPSGTERGWTSDIVVDPSSGRPTVVFSVRSWDDDRRYMYASWTGGSWQVQTLAPAGRALYAGELDYTGLVALDPTDPAHVVMSADVSPTTGQPLVSATDGQRHWELWDGRRGVGGTWTWAPLTADSAVDNIRPVLNADQSGASALLWLRGTYRSYTDYTVDVVGVITRGNGANVSAGAPAWVAVTDVLPTPAPRPERAVPVVGRFDGHAAADLFLVRAGSAPDDLFLGDDQRSPTAIAGPKIASSAIPVPGDFDGNGRTDIFWYAPGPAIDRLWSTTDLATFTGTTPRQVSGDYTPVPGDFDGDGRADIYWYAPGPARDYLWRSTGSRFSPVTARQVDGTHTPVPGDFDGDGHTDILWYGKGVVTNTIWFGNSDGTFTSVATRPMGGSYTPAAGDFDGDGRTDVLWYAPGSRAEYLWIAASGRSFAVRTARQVVGTYAPIVADVDGDGADDIHWYAPGATADQLWWSADGPLASVAVARVNF